MNQTTAHITIEQKTGLDIEPVRLPVWWSDQWVNRSNRVQ
jgi:hypothetical protein